MPPLKYPRDIQGWLYPREALALFDLARDQQVLEIGTWRGKSTVILAQSATFVHTVDTHNNKLYGVPLDTLQELRKNLLTYDVEAKVAIHVMDSAHIGTMFQPQSFGLIFVDGDHFEEGLTRDTRNAFRLIKPGGHVCIHDYARPTKRMRGVRLATDKLIPSERIRVVQSMAIIQENGEPLLS